MQSALESSMQRKMDETVNIKLIGD